MSDTATMVTTSIPTQHKTYLRLRRQRRRRPCASTTTATDADARDGRRGAVDCRLVLLHHLGVEVVLLLVRRDLPQEVHRDEAHLFCCWDHNCEIKALLVQSIRLAGDRGAHLVEEVVLVDVAAVRKDAEVATRAVDEDGLELPRLVVGALVRVEAQVPQPLEVRLFCRSWIGL